MNIQALKRDREEVYDIYLKVWAAVDTSRHRMEDFDELSKHADLLDSNAPSFFSSVLSLLVGDAILALCRITDAPRYRSDERVTIKLLEETIDSPPPMTAVKEAMKPLRDLRDNWISHADLQRALAGAQATVILNEIRAAADVVLAWLKQFGDLVGLPTSEPVDQGTWTSAISLTAALRDAEAVHMTYIDLLRNCGALCPSALAIDHQLTARRARWEDSPFSETDWLAIRARVLKDGLSKVCNSLALESPYMAILLQTQSPDGDITINTTDRRVAARIKKESALLLRELKQSGGQG